jgi:hypothetical protein
MWKIIRMRWISSSDEKRKRERERSAQYTERNFSESGHFED